MRIVDELRHLLRISHSKGIARRYFVVNGFDGALTMLGLCIGFLLSEETDIAIITTACLGATIALGVSGVNSAWLSETAERQLEVRLLERAMLADLQRSSHGRAATVIPLVIALVNGLSPMLICLTILTPLLLQYWNLASFAQPLQASLGIAFGCIFLLGVYIGRISGKLWLWAGLRAIIVALITAALILVVTN